MDLEIPKYDLDYSKPIIAHGNFTRVHNLNSKCMIDKNIVQRKFELWNTIGRLGLLEGNFKTQKEKIMHYKSILLPAKDKTIYAYANFKLNNQPFKSRYYQDILLSDTYDRILFIGSNQIGKSVTLDVDCATEFSKDHGKNWRGLLVSNTFTQSKERMGNIRQLLDTGNITYKEENTSENKTGKQMSMTVISFTFYDVDGKPKYTNKLICCPHTSAALGYPCDEIWADEIEFWENVKGGTLHWIKQVAIPRLFDTKGKIKLYSNPVEGGVLQTLSREKTKNGKLLWHVYRFNYWDREDANQEFFDRSSIGMNNAEVASTLLGDFARAKGAFLSKQEIDDQFDAELDQKREMAGYGKETYWFLDVGEVHDQCCLIGGYALDNPNELAQQEGLPLIHAFYIHKYPVGYPIARVVGAESDFSKDDGWEEDASDNPSVKQTLIEYGEDIEGRQYYPAFAFDATNNMAILPLMQSIGIDAIPIKFSGPKKWEMYQRYQMYTQQRWFKRVNDNDDNAIMSPDGVLSTFAYQASKLLVKKRSDTGTRYGQIHHENEDDLDDTQDAVVGMIYMIECPDISSFAFDIIDNNGKSRMVEIEEDKEKEELKKNNPELQGQYIPSYYNNDEMQNWLDRQKDYT